MSSPFRMLPKLYQWSFYTHLFHPRKQSNGRAPHRWKVGQNQLRSSKQRHWGTVDHKSKQRNRAENWKASSITSTSTSMWEFWCPAVPESTGWKQKNPRSDQIPASRLGQPKGFTLKYCEVGAQLAPKIARGASGPRQTPVPSLHPRPTEWPKYPFINMEIEGVTSSSLY